MVDCPNRRDVTPPSRILAFPVFPLTICPFLPSETCFASDRWSRFGLSLAAHTCGSPRISSLVSQPAHGFGSPSSHHCQSPTPQSPPVLMTTWNGQKHPVCTVRYLSSFCTCGKNPILIPRPHFAKTNIWFVFGIFGILLSWPSTMVSGGWQPCRPAGLRYWQGPENHPPGAGPTQRVVRWWPVLTMLAAQAL